MSHLREEFDVEEYRCNLLTFEPPASEVGVRFMMPAAPWCVPGTGALHSSLVSILLPQESAFLPGQSWTISSLEMWPASEVPFVLDSSMKGTPCLLPLTSYLNTLIIVTHALLAFVELCIFQKDVSPL